MARRGIQSEIARTWCWLTATFVAILNPRLALCFCLNLVSLGLANMVDAYCREVASSGDDVEVCPCAVGSCP